jgi:hypothetical protein
MKSTSDDGALPVDPNNVTGKKSLGNAETDNRPADRNNVTSDKVTDTSESENRPAKPGV